MCYLLLPFIVVLAVSYVIGVRCSKATKSQDEYFLAGRSLGWGLLTMTLVATQIGGGFVLGTADAASEIGPFAIFFPLGYALGFLGLGLGIGGKLREMNLSTASEVFERWYNSQFLKRFAALLSVISLTGILIAQAVALRSFLTALGITDSYIFIFSWAIVILYTTQGGFLAVVWTDTIQAAVMIGLLIITFFITLTAMNNSTLPSIDISASWQLAQPRLLGYILMPLFFTFIEQDMVQRCFAARSKRDIAIGGLLSALILMCMAIIPVAIGSYGKMNGFAANGGSSTFMEVIKLFKSPILLSIAASATLLAIVSTASSLLSAVSSNISKDFAMTSSLRTTKLITLGIGIGAFLGALYATNILSCMIASYELSVAALLVPFMAAIFLKDRCAPYRIAALLAAFGGTFGFVATKIFPLGILSDCIPLGISFLGFVVGYMFVKTKQPSTWCKDSSKMAIE